MEGKESGILEIDKIRRGIIENTIPQNHHNRTLTSGDNHEWFPYHQCWGHHEPKIKGLVEKLNMD